MKDKHLPGCEAIQCIYVYIYIIYIYIYLFIYLYALLKDGDTF